jgi:hypothetical protein
MRDRHERRLVEEDDEDREEPSLPTGETDACRP